MEAEFPVEVVGRREIAERIVELRLRAVDGEAPRWEPGAHIDLVFTRFLSARYSLCGDPEDRDSDVLTVAVQREKGGRGSSLYVHNMVKVGERLRARGPRNGFPLLPAGRYLFIAGGIGITPLLPMLHTLTARGERWSLAYAGRSRASMAYLPELAALAESGGGEVEVWARDEAGPLGLDALLGEAGPGADVYCCGPESLLAAVEQRCAGWPAGVLHVERFAPKPPDPAADAPFEVACARSGVTVQVPSGITILDALDRAGVYAEALCRVGTCGECETPILEGTADHRDFVLGPQERERGKVIMTCCSRALGPRLVLDV